MKNITPEIIAKAKTAASADELLAIAKENGVELTSDEAKTYFDQVSASGVVADEELDLVAGGCGTTFANGERVRLKYKRCSDCKSDIGIYYKHTADGIASIKCDSCGAIIMSGIIGLDVIEKL